MQRQKWKLINKRDRSLYNGITGIPPKLIVVFHHEMNNRGNEVAQDIRPVFHLAPVDTTVPGGPSMHNLISQYIEPVKNHGQEFLCIGSFQRPVGRFFASLKCLDPLAF